MNICMKCGKTFDKAGTETDDVGYTYSICPYCESDDFISAEMCPFTGDYIPNGQGVSAQVSEKVREKLEDIVADFRVINKDQLYALFEVIAKWLEGRS